jgi:hypothetical protein
MLHSVKTNNISVRVISLQGIKEHTVGIGKLQLTRNNQVTTQVMYFIRTDRLSEQEAGVRKLVKIK